MEFSAFTRIPDIRKEITEFMVMVSERLVLCVKDNSPCLPQLL